MASIVNNSKGMEEEIQKTLSENPAIVSGE
jgi:Na+/H+-translocating membrane pyrophosphatase